MKKNTIYVEISDLINFIYYENRVTGIQRLVSQICWSFLNEDLKFDYKYCGLISESDNNFREFDREVIYELIKNIITGNGCNLAENIGVLRDSSKIIDYSDGDIIFGTGASFSFKNYIYSIRKLKNKHHILYGSLIYDLIPYHLLDGLPIELPKVFSLWLSELPYVSDLLISISEYTKMEFTTFCDKQGISLEDTINTNLPLATFPIQKFEKSDVISRYGIGKNYCLFVSTMEVRKNHVVLLEAWKQLLVQYGDDKIPKLVFVGKVGYGFEELVDAYEKDENLKKKIVFIHDANDQDLEFLYENCLFTLYPSLYEGWGLPVTESLSRGKFCLSSNSSSLPEAGGHFAEYFDPQDALEIATLVSKYIFNKDKLCEKEKIIESEYQLRTWREYVTDFEKVILEAIRLNYFNKNNHIPISLGELYHFQYDFLYGESFQKFVKNRSAAYSMLHQGNWFVPENSSRWSHQNVSSIKINLQHSSSDSKVKCYLRYWLPVNLVTMNFFINVQRKNVLQVKLTPLDFGIKVLMFEVLPDRDGNITIEFVGTNKVRIEGTQEPRDLLVALLSFGCASNESDRLNLLENINEYEINLR